MTGYWCEFPFLGIVEFFCWKAMGKGGASKKDLLACDCTRSISLLNPL